MLYCPKMSDPREPLSLRIASVGVRIETPRLASYSRELRAMFGAFVKKPQASDWKIRLRPLRRLGNAKTPSVVQAGRKVRLAWSRFEGLLDWQTRSGTVFVHSSAVVGTFLRAFLSHVLSRRGGFLLHGAGVTSRGGAYVFPGVSGAGKSTFSRQWPAEQILSDEIVAVVKRGGRWTAYGTPFDGDVRGGRNESGPLKGILFLEKARRWAKKPVDRRDAARKLLRCVLSFEAKTDVFDRLLGLVDDVTAAAPAHALSFSRTSRDAARSELLCR